MRRASPAHLRHPPVTRVRRDIPPTPPATAPPTAHNCTTQVHRKSAPARAAQGTRVAVGVDIKKTPAEAKQAPPPPPPPAGRPAG